MEPDAGASEMTLPSGGRIQAGPKSDLTHLHLRFCLETQLVETNAVAFLDDYLECGKVWIERLETWPPCHHSFEHFFS